MNACKALSGKFTHGLYSVLVGFIAVFQRKQHSNLSYTITLSPSLLPLITACVLQRIWLIFNTTPKHTQKQMRYTQKICTTRTNII